MPRSPRRKRLGLFISGAPAPPQRGHRGSTWQVICQWFPLLGSPQELLNISDARPHASPIKSEPLGWDPSISFLKDALVVLSCSQSWAKPAE